MPERRVVTILIVLVFLFFGVILTFDEHGPESARISGHVAGLITIGLAGGMVGATLTARWIFRTVAEQNVTKPKDSDGPKTNTPGGQ